MASTTGSAGGPSSPQPNGGIPALTGEVIYLPEEHYDDLSISTIQSKARELKAEFSSTIDKCTIILTNENSPHWATQSRVIIEAAKKLVRPPQILPYHWLSICWRRGRRVELEELVAPVPFMVQHLTDRYPLKVWVSKNVERQAEENPEQAYQRVMDDVEAMGAIVVTKRANADVLVVDRLSKFYAIVKKEKEDNHRDWQKLAQRDWVEFCRSNKVLQLATPRDDDTDSVKSEMSDQEDQLAASEGDADSMVAEDDLPVGRGPGRPTSRVEYTPEDDDFLVRYLACYYPTGSWTSQKTFTSLIHDEDQYPPISRHTWQSWRERFKKNSSTFSRRVQRFVAEGIDATLKTRGERAKAAEKKAQRVAAGEGATRAESTDTTQAGTTIPPRAQESETSAGPAEPLVPSPPRAAVVPTTRTLVEHDSAEVPDHKDRKGKGREIPASKEETGRVLVPETLAEDNRMEVDDTPPEATTGKVASMPEPRIDAIPPRPAAVAVAASSSRPTADLSDGIASTAQTEAPSPGARAEKPHNKRARSAFDDIPTQPASALLGKIATKSRLTTPSNRYSSPVEEDRDVHRAGSTPLRQQIRSIERRRLQQGHSTSARRLSKRAASPDKVYAHVNLPPPRPVVVEASNLTPPRREPPRELTPVERAESVLAGSRIVQDVAAQYRAKVAALRQRFGVGNQEIAAATKEAKLRKGGKAAVDWVMLEAVLEEQYGR